jgi:hypothetical protein
MAILEWAVIRQPAKDKVAAKRLEANKGGREEEEKHFGISTGLAPGRLRGNKESEKTQRLLVWSKSRSLEFPDTGQLWL